MTSTLQQLTENLALRYPNKLPPKHTELNELCHLQGQQEVVEYVIQYLRANQEELDRESILKGS